MSRNVYDFHYQRCETIAKSRSRFKNDKNTVFINFVFIVMRMIQVFLINFKVEWYKLDAKMTSSSCRMTIYDDLF